MCSRYQQNNDDSNFFFEWWITTAIFQISFSTKQKPYDTTNENQNQNMMFQNICLAILAVIPMLMTAYAAGVSHELFLERTESLFLFFLHSFSLRSILDLSILGLWHSLHRW